MLMKDGTVVPIPLSQALEADVRALKIFMDMSPTYQKMCVEQITQSDEDSMRKRVETALKGIHKYGEARKGRL